MIALLLFFIPFYIYLKTLCPTSYAGDSGELITAVYHLGIAHPPGYPLYCIFGKIFTIIFPYGTIAFRVNLLSAVFSAVTVLVLYKLISKLLSSQNIYYSIISAKLVPAGSKQGAGIHREFCAISAALCFAFSDVFWSQSVIAEVYTASIFFLVLSIYLLILWSESKNKIYIYLFGFFYGASIVSHQTLILLLPIFVIYIYIEDKYCWANSNYKKLNLNNWTIFFGIFLLVLFLNLYLPIRSLANPEINWGNPLNLKQTLFHVLRKQYVTPPSVHFLYSTFRQVQYFLKLTFQQYSFLTLFAFIGFYIAIREKNRLLLMLVLTNFILPILLIFILNFDMTGSDINNTRVFFISCFLFLNIFLGIGINSLIFTTKRWKLIILISPILLLIYHYNINNLSRNFIAYDYCKNMLKTLKENSIFKIAHYDTEMFTIGYLVKVEGLRSDILIYDDYGFIFKKIPAKKELIQMVEKGKEVYCSLISQERNYQEFNYIPYGLVYQIKSKNENIKNSRAQILPIHKIWDKYMIRDSNKNQLNETYHVRTVLTNYYFMYAENLNFTNEREKAIKFFNKAVKISYDIDIFQFVLWNKYVEEDYLRKEFVKYLSLFEDTYSIETQYCLGAYYTYQAKDEQALNRYRRALKINYFHSDTHNALGNVYSRLGNYSGAILEYKRAMRLGEKPAGVYRNLADAYLKVGKPELAISQILKALDLEPDYAKSYKNLSVAYSQIDDIKLAKWAAFKYVKSASKDPDGYYNLGCIYQQSGDMNKAIIFWKKTLALAPQHKAAQNNLSLVLGKY